ncbi:MAG: restriction endonuclease, partial [Anaerolineae bacterium]|nr:restriction endonuclease [Anaerolineae bacterium]
STTDNRGLIGEAADLNIRHLGDVRQTTIVYHLTSYLLYNKFRDPGQEPKLHLFGQLKGIVRQWLDDYLRCSGGTFPAQVLYQEIADMACERIKAAITEAVEGDKPVLAILDAYNPTGSSRFVNFTTAKATRWQTDPRKCPVNWVICDSDWEAEFCRVVERHPRVRAYVANQGMGFEVPYLFKGTARTYIPDFIVQIDDGRPDPLNLVVEIKGYRKEDAKEKANTMRSQWVPGVNNLKEFGRWTHVEFTEVFEIEAAFDKLVASLVAA